jgi:tetratricopeptide (TPR) repeat protein
MSDPATATRPATRHALVIGVNGSTQAPSIAPLQGAERDARTIAAALDGPVCAFAVQTLFADQATASEIRRVIEDLLYAATDATELLVYFSGHAAPVALGQRQNETFLVTSDFDANRAARQPERYVSLRWLYEQLYRDETARSVVLVLDCCYAGNVLGVADDRLTLDFREVIEQFRSGLDPQTSTRYRDRLRAIVPVVGPGQTAREQAGMGLASRHISRLLSGEVAPEYLADGQVTLQLLIDHLQKALPNQAPAPLVAGQAMFVLADHRAAVRAARSSPFDQAAKREELLQAMIHDHSGFIASRLESFVGREQELAEVRERIAQVQQSGGYVTVTGQAGQGKSSMLARLLQEFDPETTAHHFIPLKPGPDHQVGLMRNLLARLIRKHNLSEIYVASESRPALRDYFAQALREIAAAGQREIIVIDGLDQIEEDLDGQRDLSFLPLEPPPGIVFLLGTRPNDALKPLELRKPHTEYWLPNLSRSDFDRILRHRGVQPNPTLADRFYTAMQENALYLDLVARELVQPGAPAPEVLITRIADNPDNLFSLSIERLRKDRERWRTVLKPILGLLLAARDPLSMRALRSLIAADDDECREGLQRLGGLLTRDGEGRFYLYHLKLNDFLRQDLQQPGREYVFAADEEEAYHQKLADWCSGGRGGLAAIWQPAPGDALENERRHYARQHYLPHLAAARSYEHLWQEVDDATYLQAKLRHDPSGRSAVLDLDIVREAVVASASGDPAAEVAILPRLWRYSLLRGSLASQADNLPNRMFPLMARLGDPQEAVNLAELLSDPLRKVLALLQIGVACKQTPAQASLSRQVFARAEAVLRDLFIEEPQQIADALVDRRLRSEILTVLLSGDPDLIQAVSQATRAIDNAPGCLSILANDVLVLTRIVLIVANALSTTDTFRDVLGPTTVDDFGDFETLLSRTPGWLDAIAMALQQTGALDDMCGSVRVLATPMFQLPLQILAAAILTRAVQPEEAQQFEADVTARVNEGVGDEPLQICTFVLILVQRFDEARTTAQAIEEAWIRANALSAVATALAQVQRFDQAAVALDEARTTAQAIEHARSRANALSAVAAALVQAQRFDEARTTAQAIEHASSRAFALRAVATALAQAQHFDEAAVVLDEARTTAQAIEDARSRANALRAVATALAQAQRFDEAAVMLDEARTTAQAIEVAGSRADALRAVATALAQAQRFDEARTTAQAIEDARSRANALSAVAAALAQAQRFDEARTTAQAIEAADDRANALRAVATALAQAQRFDEAAVALDEARTTAQAIEDASSRANALSAVATALAQAQRFDEARTTAQAIEHASSRAFALRAVATALAQAQHFDEAAVVLDEARTTAQAIEHASSRAYELRAVATALAQAQRFDEAAVVLDKARTTAQAIEDASSRANALSAVATALAQAQRFDEARTTAQAIEEAWSRAFALSAVATVLAQIQRFDEARITAQAIEHASSRANALSAVATALAQAQRFDEAAVVLDEARTTAQAIEAADDRANALSAVATALAQAQRFDEAAVVLDEARTTAQAIEDAPSRANALRAVATALAQIQRFDEAAVVLDEARTTAQAIEEAWIRANALSAVATALAQIQRFDEARTTAQAIEHAWSRANALSAVATALAQAQRFDEALVTTGMISDSSARARAISSIAEHLAQAERLDELRALVLDTWQAATTRSEVYKLTAMPQARLIVESELHRGLLDSIAWVQRVVQGA